MLARIDSARTGADYFSPAKQAMKSFYTLLFVFTVFAVVGQSGTPSASKADCRKAFLVQIRATAYFLFIFYPILGKIFKER